MYTSEGLRRIKFFKDLEVSLDDVLDSLTKVVSRKHTIKLINDLIENKEPFGLVMLDLDNFKLINDNYGHSVGDKVLFDVAQSLIDYVGENGIVGRFGGDEFLIVFFGECPYDRLYSLIKESYMNEKVFRRFITCNDVKIFVTATSGAAAFPNNANNFNDLFAMVDKTLYRGKTKGRNCFIVYVEEKHAKLDITKPISNLLHQILNNVFSYLTCDSCVEIRLNNAFKFISDKYRCKISLIMADEVLYSDLDASSLKGLDVCSIVDGCGIFSCNNFNDIKNNYPMLYEFCHKNGVLSILLSKVTNLNGDFIGYIVFSESLVEKIWQEDELILITFVSKILTMINE